MKSRTIILLIILVLGAAGIVYVIKTDPLSTVKSGMKGVLPESTDRIDRVEIIGSSDTIQILKSEVNWKFEEGEGLNNEAIESLLFTASNLRVVSIVSSEEILEQPDFITIRFMQKRKLVSEFRFLEFRGRNVICREGDEQAYVVELPGYENRTLQKVFSVNPDHYRDHLLLNLLPSEISSVEITPLRGSGFSVSQDILANISVQDLSTQEVAVSERKIRLLLSYFNVVRFEEYLPADKVPAGFNPSMPSAMIRVTEFSGESHEFRIFQWRSDGADKPDDLFKALVLYNENPQILIVNYTYLDLLIRGLEVYQGTE